MEILVDREITGALEVFSPFGTVRLFDGRALRAADVGDAEILLVRSVTRVDENLLGDCRVRFVGSATAGIDHIDRAFLAERGIHFSYAPGCNSRAVAEHVACCIFSYAKQRSRRVDDLKVGIVGFGHVGSKLGALLGRLGVEYVVNDPPLGKLISGARAIELDEMLGCDVVTLHVPLTDSGPHPTAGLFDRRRIGALRERSLLINAARGGVVDEQALAERLLGARPIYAALDCWVGEPQITPRSVELAWRATPHVAGHTVEARAAAAAALQHSLGSYLNVPAQLPDLLGPATTALEMDHTGGIDGVLSAIYPMLDFTMRMREMVGLDSEQRRTRFDSIRLDKGLRREFARFGVARNGLDADTVGQLQALDFDVY